MMAFDLTTIEPSAFMEFRDNWIKETGLESVGADRLFDNAGLLELVELNQSELKEYAQEIGCSVIERRRLIKGIMKLNGAEASTPSPSASIAAFSNSYSNLSNSSSSNITTPYRKASKTDKKEKKVYRKLSAAKTDTKPRKRTRKRTKSKSRSRTPRTPTPTSPTLPNYSSSTISSISSNHNSGSSNNDNDSSDDNAPMYDPTARSRSRTQTPTFHKKKSEKSFADFTTIIATAMQQLESDGNATKNDIRQSFMHFRTKLTEREMKLLHDVSTTVDKKTRLLRTQLEYVKDNNGGGDRELACDPTMCLDIERQHILTSIICAGWVKGASSDNKEEQEMQERERKRRELYQQQYLTVERLKEITLFERDCATKREETVRLTNEVQDEIQKINDRSRQCESELAAAKPLLEAAKELVSTITKTQLNEIRVLKKPPAVVELVMSAVTVMLGNKIKSWRDIQKILSNPRFISSVLDFDTMALKKKTRDECKKYVKHEDFNEERANKASKVAGPLVKWVKSQIEYSILLDVVRPMQKQIKILSRKLDKKQRQLSMCTQVVNTLEMKISKSRTEINQMVENMIKLQDIYNFGADDDALCNTMSL